MTPKREPRLANAGLLKTVAEWALAMRIDNIQGRRPGQPSKGA